MAGKVTKPLAQRFGEKVEVASTGCHLWTGYKMPNGYGQFGGWDEKGKRRMLLAHRVAYELAFGQIPIETLVCHKCDVPACVNPDHLFLGTQTDNMGDAVLKGRAARGERQGSSKLTEQQVKKIKMARGTHESIASYFGVSRRTVGMIKRGERWGHVA